MNQKKEPGPSGCWSRALTWRRPTLAGPFVQLPSALRRFTSGFGMGPGGSTTLWSPEGDAGVNGGCHSFQYRDSGGRGLSYCSFQHFRFQLFFRPSALWHPHGGFSDLTNDRACAVPVLRLHISDSKNRNQAERMISTSRLNTLPHFHLKPINVVVSDDPSGKTHLGRSLALRCFQRLSLPHLATRPCS